ncbi:MAG: 23S rRNA (pseudouridine(1915)-N(3))-methyltransferase RlmH [Clostridiales bacterium]|nr:23S rRNA (pseudouridine(1915)-N(3))-methyltransferase RlmH [Clostridiales bacterium]
MVGIHLLCVGKLKEPFYQAAAAEYAKRLSAHCKLSLVQLPEERLPERPSPAQVEDALAREGAAILARCPRGAPLVALCVEGALLSSEALAQRLDGWMVSGVSSLAFVIGGSFGLHPMVKEQAALRLSMSPMTFPHHLARIMLLEQLYRGFQINAGSRYHK